MSLHFNISGILRSKSSNLKPPKILEAPDPATQFEIPEHRDPRLHLYENLQHWLIIFVILLTVLHNHLVHFWVDTHKISVYWCVKWIKIYKSHTSKNATLTFTRITVPSFTRFRYTRKIPVTRSPGSHTRVVVTAYLLGRHVVRSGSKVYPSIGVDAGQDKENACRRTGKS